MTNGTLVADSALGLSTAASSSSITKRTHRVLNYLVLLLVPVQFFAAGLAVFGASSFRMHQQVGWLMQLLALLSFVVSILARKRGASVLRAFVLLLFMILQPVLAFVPRASMPELSALHPVVGLAIGVVAWQIEVRLRGTTRS
jgi:hypothetical protein